MRSLGHMLRRDSGYERRRMLEMELPGKRRRGRPKRKFMDAVRKDMLGVTEGDVENKERWRQMICCGNLLWEQLKEEELLNRRTSSILNFTGNFTFCP